MDPEKNGCIERSHNHIIYRERYRDIERVVLFKYHNHIIYREIYRYRESSIVQVPLIRTCFLGARCILVQDVSM